MFAAIQWLQTWPSFFYGRYAAARPITAPLFFESETAGLMFVLHHWSQGFRWLFFSWFPRENAAADYKHGHSQNEDHKLHLLHRWCSPSPDTTTGSIIRRSALQVFRNNSGSLAIFTAIRRASSGVFDFSQRSVARLPYYRT
jgi:hypothetical protein